MFSITIRGEKASQELKLEQEPEGHMGYDASEYDAEVIKGCCLQTCSSCFLILGAGEIAPRTTSHNALGLPSSVIN